MKNIVSKSKYLYENSAKQYKSTIEWIYSENVWSQKWGMYI